MNQQRQVSPAERASLFAQMTRQHKKTSPSIAGASGGTSTFTLNKVRLTNRVRLEIAFTLTVTHASLTTFVPDDFAPFNALRRVSIDMNNGFSPFVVSGTQLMMYSFMRDDAGILTRASSGRGKVVMPLVASSAGTANVCRMLVDLPLSLNDRDPVSLIVTQNQQTNVDVTVDFATGIDLLAVTTGMTAVLSAITITPLQESFSVPPVKEAVPDIGILKLVQASTQAISGSGQQTIKLPTGMTYRKIALLITDANGNGVTDASLTGNIDIILNQSDIPYSLKPSILAAINHEQFGRVMPDGLYLFDFSYQGLANYGGLRDYIDTEQLTEFWIQFTAGAAGNVSVVYEQLAKLNQTV